MFFWNKAAVVFLVAVLFSYRAEFTTEKIELLSNHTFDEVSEKKAMDNQDSSVHSELTNIDSNNVKLVLEWGSFVWFFLNRCEDLTFAGHISDNTAEEPSLTGLDLSTREKHWGWNIVMTLGVLGVRLVISLSLFTLVNSLFIKVIRFSSHGGFVTQNTDSLKDDAVDWYVHTVFDLDFITDLDVVFVEDLFLGVSKNSDLKFKIKISSRFSSSKFNQFQKFRLLNNLDYFVTVIDLFEN